MSRWPRGSGAGWPRLTSWPALALVLGLWLALGPATALAHPLDEVLQGTYLTLSPQQIEVELDITPGVLVAPQVLSQLDPNGDGEIVETEAQAYAAVVLRGLHLAVDGQPLTLALSRVEKPTVLSVQAGYGLTRIFATAALPESATGSSELTYRNDYQPAKSAYQVNAFVDSGAAVSLGAPQRDSIQQSMSMAYTIGDGAPITTGDAPTASPADVTGQAQRLLAVLAAPVNSPWQLTLALGLAVLLGGLHALTPGHGKTLVAAYLVGSRGTVRHAVFLGAIVTVTHTASVIAIGILALVASQYVVPQVLVPLLTIVSGAMVVVLGVRLIAQRWSALRGQHADSASHSDGHHDPHPHSHSQPGGHGYYHDHGDGHVHAHLPPADGIRPGNLVALGISGGMVPCPEALGIMIVAIGLNQVLLGLGLIVSFSFGLAAVLMAIGILLVRARPLVERVAGSGGRWSTLLPLGSAVIVTVLGVGITFSGVMASLR